MAGDSKNVIFSKIWRRPNFTLKYPNLNCFSTKIWTSLDFAENHIFVIHVNVYFVIYIHDMHLVSLGASSPYPKIVEPLRDPRIVFFLRFNCFEEAPCNNLKGIYSINSGLGGQERNTKEPEESDGSGEGKLCRQ